jgi:hypothetical protein
MFVHISLELLVGGGLGLQALGEIGTVASWDRLLLELHKLSTGLLEVVLSGDDIVVNSKVWYEIIFVVLVHVGLELLVSGGLGLQTLGEIGTVASWNGLLLELHELSTSLLEVVLGGDNVMIDSKVWYKIVFVVLVHIGLKFLISGSLGFEAFWEVSTVASWD